MILNSIKAEHTDELTGLVVKRIITSEGENFNRKLAVNNKGEPDWEYMEDYIKTLSKKIENTLK